MRQPGQERKYVRNWEICFERCVTSIESLCSLNWPITSGGRSEGCGNSRLFEETRQQKPFLYNDDRRKRDVLARAKGGGWIG